jgi:hypothetical protein
MAEPVPDNEVKCIKQIDKLLDVFVTTPRTEKDVKWWATHRMHWRNVIDKVKSSPPQVLAPLKEDGRRAYWLLPEEIRCFNDDKEWFDALSTLVTELTDLAIYPYDSFVKEYVTNELPPYMAVAPAENNGGLPSGANPRAVDVFRLKRQLTALQQELVATRAAHAQEIAELKAQHAKEMTELKAQHAKEMTELKAINERLRLQVEDLKRQITRLY